MKLAAWIAAHSSVAAFAEAIGTGQSSVYAWKSGARVPRPDTMARIVTLTKGKVRPSDFYEIVSRHGSSDTPETGRRGHHDTVKRRRGVAQMGEAR